MDCLPARENVLQHVHENIVETHLQRITKMASIATEETMKANRSLTSLKRPWSPSIKWPLSVQKTLQGLIGSVLRERKFDLCAFRNTVVEFNAKIFKSKKVEKGLAFSTCISVNECVYHNCRCQRTVVRGRMVIVKIDLGAHVDGYIAVCLPMLSAK